MANGFEYRTVSIASDGESKCGDALVEITMRWPLSHESPSIYPQLHNLPLLNLLVGKDDITADKDFKHIFKCQRNAWMRDKGVLVNGHLITVPVLTVHLKSNDNSSSHVRSLMNPNDKQDVVLGYSLLKAIWELPPLPSGSHNSAARDALRLYGQFAYFLIFASTWTSMNNSSI